MVVLKKKHTAADEDTRYVGTVLGKPADPRAVRIEGADFTSLQEWKENAKGPPVKEINATISAMSSRRQSSALSSLGDESMVNMEF